MQIAKNTIVTITYELSNLAGEILENGSEAVSYLHGGYDGIFPTVEEALEGKNVGDDIEVTLEPEYAFGEYEAELIRAEPRHLFPAEASVGMQFEGAAEGTDEFMLYTVTEITEDTVMVDGNHPLAGQTLKFKCHVTDVRPATEEEITHGHAHGDHGHHH
ncbi:FKBP-type peptidyl-prolyl cis-trans isomerase [Sulfuriferula thiophila]|uniref:FKBP-type peptidyl-prolyl cis-trans isomerase n=1 Tax=Sulfuriferula thiophila TaxID=1781211 RepID=UPI000F608E52|nr:peptidylprolyl isomerase [Sulfuriferula thiophila]